MLTNNEKQEFQKIMEEKQNWLKRSITEINKENFEKAIALVNFDSGCNLRIQNILEKYIEIPEVEIEETNPSTYEDINIEDEEETIQ